MKRLVLVATVCLMVFGPGWVCPEIQAARLQRGPYLQIATLVPSPDGTFSYVDTAATNYTARFYRLTWP